MLTRCDYHHCDQQPAPSRTHSSELRYHQHTSSWSPPTPNVAQPSPLWQLHERLPFRPRTTAATCLGRVSTTHLWKIRRNVAVGFSVAPCICASMQNAEILSPKERAASFATSDLFGRKPTTRWPSRDYQLNALFRFLSILPSPVLDLFIYGGSSPQPRRSEKKKKKKLWIFASFFPRQESVFSEKPFAPNLETMIVEFSSVFCVRIRLFTDEIRWPWCGRKKKNWCGVENHKYLGYGAKSHSRIEPSAPRSQDVFQISFNPIGSFFFWISGNVAFFHRNFVRQV